MKLKNNTETGFHILKLKSKFRKGGYFADPSFVYTLWSGLEKWFLFLADEKRKAKKKPLLRIYDLRNQKNLNKLQEILIELKGGQEK